MLDGSPDLVLFSRIIEFSKMVVINHEIVVFRITPFSYLFDYIFSIVINTKIINCDYVAATVLQNTYRSSKVVDSEMLENIAKLLFNTVT